MSEYVDLDKRVSVLEAEMNWASGNMQKIDKDLVSIKHEMTEIRHEMTEIKNDLTDFKIKTFERFSNMQAHFDSQFVIIHKDMATLHNEISRQTKWTLTVVLAGATIISILSPVLTKILG